MTPPLRPVPPSATPPGSGGPLGPTPPTAAPDAAQLTEDLHRRAAAVLAYGGLNRLYALPLQDSRGRWLPHFAVSASGCEIVDTTGAVSIDWLSGWGPAFLGYQHPAVDEAVRRQQAAGPTISLMHPVEIEVAERLCAMIPCAEQVSFGKNGSDAVNAAVRVAKAATGRDIILSCGFHGFHEWFACSQPGVKGVPLVLQEYLHQFEYNDLDGLAELFERFGPRVAAVLMEPTSIYLPDPGYLAAVADMAHEHGALLIFDEVVTGFRLANGGAQEHFGVDCDLACVGKALSNGMPLSAVVGRREYMERLPETGYGMTFRGETLSLAAARAVLTVLDENDVSGHLARMGTRLRDGYRELCARHGVNSDLWGPPARMTFCFFDQGNAGWEHLQNLFVREALANGVLTDTMAYPSFAHDEDSVDRTLERLEPVVLALAEEVAVGVRDRLAGQTRRVARKARTVLGRRPTGGRS